MPKRLALALSVGASLALGSVATAQPIRPPEESFVLLGIIVVDGENGRAWLSEPRLTQNRPVTVRQGEMVGPYRVTRILDDRVVLEGPGGVISVPMLTTGGGSAVAAGPASPLAPAPQPAGGRSVGGEPQNPAVSAAPGPVPRNPLTLPAAQLQDRVRAMEALQASAQAVRRDPAGNPIPPPAPATQPTTAGQPGTPQQGASGPQSGATQSGSLTADQILAGGTPTFQNPNVRFFPIGDPRRNQSFGPPSQ